MLLTLIGLIVVLVFCFLVILNGDCNFFSEVACPIFSAVAIVGFFAYAPFSWHYVAAGYKKDIINREYGTNYSQSEIFYASDVIDTIHEIKRTRIEVNGDIAADKSKAEK